MIEIEPYPSVLSISKGDSAFFVDRRKLAVCGMQPPSGSILTDLSIVKASSIIKTGEVSLRVKHPFRFLSEKIGSMSVYDLFAMEFETDTDGLIEKGKAKIDNSRIAAAVITLSDRGAVGKREDKTGPAVRKIIEKVADFSDLYLIPDDRNLLRYVMAECADRIHYDLVITNGGTGVSPRDITADVTESLVEKRMTGFEQAMMAAGIRETYKAVLSRSVVGIRGKTLIINLPGSTRAASTNLNSIIDAIGHLIKKLNGDPSECGS